MNAQLRFNATFVLIIALRLFPCAVSGATVSWVGGSGDWNTPTNWTSGVVPGPDDDVVFDVPGNVTVTHSSGTHSVRSIQSREAFVLSGGSLTVSNLFVVGTNVTLSGGILRGGTIITTNGARLVFMPVGFGLNMLDGVTVNGEMDLINSSVTVRNGLTLNGTAYLGDQSSQSSLGIMNFTGSQTLGGNGTVALGPHLCNALRFENSGMTLTIQTGITVRGHSGSIGSVLCGFGGAQDGTVINQGTITADVAGGTIHFNILNLTNAGTLRATSGTLDVNGLRGNVGNASATNGGHLDLDGTYVNDQDRLVIGSTLTLRGVWTNSASITLNDATLNLSGTWANATSIALSNATLYLNGTWANAGTITGTNTTLNLGGGSPQLGTVSFPGPGSIINVAGNFTSGQLQSISYGPGAVRLKAGAVVDNTGGVLTLDADTGTWLMDGGTLRGGTAITTNGVPLVFTYANSLLDAVRVNGDVDLVYGHATVRNGLTLNGTAYLGHPTNPSSYGYLDFAGSQTLAGRGTVVLGMQPCNRLRFVNEGMTLTIGPDITVRGHSGFMGASPNQFCGGWVRNVTVINHGVIAADVPGGTVTVDVQNFTNRGTIQAISGGKLEVQELRGNLGNAFVSSGAHLDLNGTFVNDQDRLVVSSTLTLRGVWTNAASITSSNATLNLAGAWANPGAIAGTNTTLNLGGSSWQPGVISFPGTGSIFKVSGSFSSAQLQSIAYGPGAMRLNAGAVVGNTGAVITLDANTGSWLLDGGTLRGGTVIATNGAQLVGGGRDISLLDGVTINGDLDLSRSYSQTSVRVMIVNGLTLNGTAYIGDQTGVRAYLIFSGNQTLSGNGTVVLGQASCNGLHFQNEASVLTIGPGITIRGHSGYMGASPNGFCGHPVIAGTVINHGTIAADMPGGSIAVLVLNLTNIGTLRAVGGSMLDARNLRGDLGTDLGILQSSGTLAITGPATNLADVQISPSGSIQFAGSFLLDNFHSVFVQPGGTVRLTGDVLGDVQNPALASLLGTFVFEGSGNSIAPQFLEAMSEDKGATLAGFSSGFALGRIVLTNGTYVRLVDGPHNSSGTQPEAVYVNSVIVPSGTILDLNGLNLYARSLQTNGPVVGGTVILIPDSGPITPGQPTSGNLVFPGELDDWTFFGRAGQNVVILVDTGSGSVVPPPLNFAEVRLLDAFDRIVTRSSNTIARQMVALTDAPLPLDGLYHIQVRAPANQPNSIGNYQITVWEVTPDIAPLVFNETAHGRIETPYSVDRWTFAAVAGQQVRFDLINASLQGVAFTLRGPNGWVGFSNVVADSGLVSLPANGDYALTAFSLDGSYDIDYAFQLVETVRIELTLGETFTGQFAGSDQAMLFRVSLSGNQPFLISLQNGGPNNRVELYAGFQLPPTRSRYMLANKNGFASDRSLLAEDTYPGTYYVLVYADSIGTPGPFTLSVQPAPFFVTQLTPGRGGSGGTNIVEIQGAGLRSVAQARLEGNGVSLVASSMTWVSSARLIAEFDCSAVPPGDYQVVVTQDATSANLPFQVSGGVGAIFQAELITPPGISFNTVETLYVEYANVGDRPMVAPLLAVRGEGLAIFPMFALKSSEVARDFWADSRPTVSSRLVSFFATGTVPGVLLPGETRRVPIHFVGFMAGASSSSGGKIVGWQVRDRAIIGGLPPDEFKFSLLQFLPPSARGIGNAQTQPDQPLDWSSLRGNVPPHLDSAAWDAIWMNYTNAVGRSVYSFFGMLEQNIDYLSRLGDSIRDTSDLLAFELAQADGLHMLRTLATGTDGYAPAPGLRLSFERSFPNTISGRYRLGALGRGWSHNWEERLVKDSSGDLTVFGQNGSQRTFKPDLRGGYLPGLGDYGRVASLPGGAFRLQEKGGIAKEFHPDGRLNFVIDPNGNRITCGYSANRLTSLAHSSGQRLDLAYNAQGRIAAITDPVGRTTRLLYNVSGDHLVAAEYYDGRVLRYRYAIGQGPQREHALTEVEFPDASHQYFTYNPQGRLESMSRDGGSDPVTFAYDNAGTVLATDAFNHTSRFLFDARGLPARVENAKGEAVKLRFDERFKLTSITDPANRSFNYAYDGRGNLTDIIDALGHRTQFAYEPQFNRLGQLIDANGNPTRYHHDTRGNLTGITDAAGKTENWGYDVIGTPNTWTNRRRQDIQYQFNPTNSLLLAKLYPDGSRADYEYDPRGNLIAASNYTGRITLDYYPTNDRLQRITYPGNRWLEYTYDDAGRRRTMTDQLGYQLRYDYDVLGRLRSITNSDSVRIVLYEYDPAGRMALKTLGNGVYTTYTYDDANRLEKLTNALPNGSVLSFFNYTYDERSRRTAMATHYGTWTYAYDDLSQLTDAVLASTDAQIPNQDLRYEYDALGNRVRTVENGVVTDYVPNQLNQYVRAGDTSFIFDHDGNLIQEATPMGTNTFVFDFENRLAGIAQNAHPSEHGYDAFGNRVLTALDGTSTHYLIDPIGLGNVVGEYGNAGNLVGRYEHGFGLASRTTAVGATEYFTFDALGSTHEIVAADGTVSSAYVYAPFGGTLRTSESTLSPFRFIGQFGVMDHATSLYSMGWRTFSSKHGRFTSPDPIGLAGQDVNFYRYAANNPVTYTDPLGLWVVSLDIGSGPLSGTLSVGYNTDTGSIILGSGLQLSPPIPMFHIAGSLGGDVDVGFGPFGFTTSNPNTGAYGQGSLFLSWPFLVGPGGILDCHSEDGCEGFFGLGFEFGLEGGWILNVDDLLAAIREILNALGWDTKAETVLVPIYARDPNQKLALTGFGQQGYVQSRALLPYRIDFENDTNATAPAQTVFVTDRLTNTLDWATFELAEIGFGDERIMLPPQTQHFETNLPVTINGASFVVQIQAGIRLDTGEVFCTFRSLDLTTDLPPPGTVGFLPPENGTGRGQGRVIFVIRPKPGLPAGTEIRNVALVDFDHAETIATDQVDPHNPALGIDPNKQARVTIDAGAPTSTVTTLPAESGRAFWVRWSGQDDPGGSGIASYDVFASTNGGTFGCWLKGAAGTSNAFIGDLGSRYAFYSVARDHVRNEEVPPAFAQAHTMIVTNAPLLSPVVNQLAGVGENLVVSNMVIGLASTNFTWRLGTPSFGARINPTNGVLHWVPACSQGSTTNTVTVWANDRTRTNISDAVSITVVVRECVAPQLGRLVLRAGDTGQMPIDLITSVPLTNLATFITADTNRLVPVGVESKAAEICTNMLMFAGVPPHPGPLPQGGEGVYVATLATCSNQFLIGTQQVAWLVLTAATNQQSAFVPVEIGPSIGTQPDGAFFTNYVTQSGTVVVVGEEPLLEAIRSTNGHVQVLLYSPVGSTNLVEASQQLRPASWTPWETIGMTNLLQPLPLLPPTNRTLFFRAVRQ